MCSRCKGEHSCQSAISIKLHTAYCKWWTRDPGFGPILEPQDSVPFTWDPTPWIQNPQAEFGTRDLYVEPGSWDPPPGTLHLGPGTRDSICGNQEPIPLRATRGSYLGTFTLIQLSLNVQFSSVAQLFQTGSCTNLYNMTKEQIIQLKT